MWKLKIMDIMQNLQILGSGKKNAIFYIFYILFYQEKKTQISTSTEKKAVSVAAENNNVFHTSVSAFGGKYSGIMSALKRPMSFDKQNINAINLSFPFLSYIKFKTVE